MATYVKEIIMSKKKLQQTAAAPAKRSSHAANPLYRMVTRELKNTLATLKAERTKLEQAPATELEADKALRLKRLLTVKTTLNTYKAEIKRRDARREAKMAATPASVSSLVALANRFRQATGHADASDRELQRMLSAADADSKSRKHAEWVRSHQKKAA